jgi:hypothetical protein
MNLTVATARTSHRRSRARRIALRRSLLDELHPRQSERLDGRQSATASDEQRARGGAGATPHLAPASVQSSSHGAAIAFHATRARRRSSPAPAARSSFRHASERGRVQASDARPGRFSSVLGRSLARLLPRSMRQYGHTCWAHRCAAANRPIRVSALRLEVPAFSRKRNLASRCATVAAFCVGEVLRLVACRGLWDRGRPRDHAVTVTACAPGKTCACFGRR